MSLRRALLILTLPLLLSACARAHGAIGDCPNYPLALLLRRVFSAAWPSSSFAAMRAELHPRICATLFGSSI
ncbi:MAG: hypothetical protein O3C24_03585 [Actinomycetota bacterium]|nr:hypothetical protein [Actinomycetota bacterium]MDA3036337.1 hypothetical protein [Actinomycetota bacterium]